MWIAALIGAAVSLAGLAWNQFSPTTRQQSSQNDFNSSEAQNARDFSAAQAELERDWQEEMNYKYNSIPGKIEQAQMAGVNPMYAVTGNSVSPVSAHGPAVSAPAASSSGLSSNPMQIAGDLLQFSKLKAEIDQMKAYTRQANGHALLSEIDALSRGQLNEATIGQIMGAIKVSEADVSLKNSQIGELASRVLLNDADVKVKSAQLGEIASQIALNSASTELKIGQLSAVAASIANTEMDTDLKAAQILLVGAQTRSEKLMSGLITQNTHLSRQERKESEQRVRSLMQQYDHKEIIQALERASADLEYRNQVLHTPKNAFEASLKWILESAVEVLSFGGYTSYNTTRSTSTTTVVDGNDYPTRGKVGF